MTETINHAALTDYLESRIVALRKVIDDQKAEIEQLKEKRNGTTHARGLCRKAEKCCQAHFTLSSRD